MKSTNTEITVHQPCSSRLLGRRRGLHQKANFHFRTKNKTQYYLIPCPGACVASFVARPPSLVSSSPRPPSRLDLRCAQSERKKLRKEGRVRGRRAHSSRKVQFHHPHFHCRGEQPMVVEWPRTGHKDPQKELIASRPGN